MKYRDIPFILILGLLMSSCVTSYFSDKDLLKFRSEAEREYPLGTDITQVKDQLLLKYGPQNKVISVFQKFGERKIDQDTLLKQEADGMTKLRVDPSIVSKLLWEKRGSYNWSILVELRVFANYLFDGSGRLIDVEVEQSAYGP